MEKVNEAETHLYSDDYNNIYIFFLKRKLSPPGTL